MPRSSRHKSHKKSNHREQSDSEEDVKTKDMNGRDEFSVRISSEKRKISSCKDSSGHGNGDIMEEYICSKRKREKTASGVAADRWNGEGYDSITMEKGIKGDNSRVDADKSSRSKSSASDLRSKSSRKHETSVEKREGIVVMVSEKEESRTGSKVDLKRNSEKDQGRKEVKDRDKGSERKVDSKRDVDVMKMDLNEERQSKRDKENADWSVQDEFRNLELEKELEKRMRRRTDSSREKHQADVKESEISKLSSKSDSAKNGRHKDENHKDGSYGDKHLEDGDKESRYREEKLQEDPERDRRNKAVKHREDGERELRYKDSKYHDDVDKDSRHRDDKHHRYEENNLREDGDRDKRKREDKYLEDDNVDSSRYRDDKHHETSNGESKDKDDKIRDGRRRDDKDNKHRDGKHRDDNDRGKRLRDIKYRDEHSRDGSNDKHDSKRSRIESTSFDRHKKSTNQDVYDHNSRDKDDKERRRGSDKDYNDSRSSFNAKDQTSEVDKKYVGGARIDTVSDQGKSSSRNADVEISPSRSRTKNSPNSGAASKSHSRIMQEDVHEERSRNRSSSKKEFGGTGGAVENASSISRSIERSSIHKDDLHYRELSVEKRPKLDARSSPLQLVDKSPSSTRHFSRSDVKRSYDIDDSGQRSGGGSKDYKMETFPGNDDTFSASSPFTRSNHNSGDSRSLLPPPHFRTGADSHSIIGSMEDESRGKSNNHRSNRRVGDSNMVRAQGNAWKGIQNWPSPVANGFMPFQHGPAAVGFHPMMQQFHTPPIFGVRPPMELNHSGVPYHMPDTDRFSVHGRPLGWRNPMDDSTPLGWDANSAALYRDESQMFGRIGWDQNRAIGGMQPWETRQDPWKGQQSGANAEPHRGRDGGIINGHSDDVSIAQSAAQSENDLNLQTIKVDGGDITQSIAVVVEKEITVAPKTVSEEEVQKQLEISKKDDDDSRRIIYLSKIGVSVDLTAPDFYDSCMNFKDIEDDSVILFLEGAMQNRKGKFGNTSKSLPQPTANDAIFQVC
ncbi:protein starmaker-like [Impatiens glandulifera]|uniref:protein starmaker-like n=1 Tax=Impatiens glandulifera TaxID=253017 RepID=UPI001FB10192|nr:protein starmaker-like [Impatiens glandulifera]